MSFFLNKKQASVEGVKGEKGDPGKQGIQGEQGIQGVPGEKGKDGTNGKDGADGKGVEDIGTAPLETESQTVKEAINELKNLIDTNHPAE